MFSILLACALSLPTAASATGELEIRVLDKDSGELIPVRMHLKDQRGKPVKPPKLIYWHDHFVVPGKAVLALRPGAYTFEMERGPEYKIRHGNFVVKRGDADTKQVEMERFVDMKAEGWWSGDLHIHRPIDDIELIARAEDLHVAPVITWWNNKNQWTGKKLPEQPLKSFDRNRFYHAMAGEDEREGGALLYFNLNAPLPITDAGREYPSPNDFLRRASREPGVHVDIEKPFWWDMPVWVASGLCDSIGLCNNHMQRDGMLQNEAWGKPRDTLSFPNPHGNGMWSESLYYRLLNSGVRIPPSAGSASGVLGNPVGYNRVYVHCGEQLNHDQWWKNLRDGQVVVTNGPLIRDPRVNGQLPGHVFRADKGATVQLSAALNLSIREPVDYLEVVQNGAVVHQVRLDQWAKAGGQLPLVEFKQSGWMLIRAVTSHPKTYRFASTGPYYVEIDSTPRISREAAQFFLDWVWERVRRIQLADQQQQESVVRYHRFARDFWSDRVKRANAP